MSEVGDNSGAVDAKQLVAFIERIERLEEEKKALTEDIREVVGEAKAFGYDAKIIRKVVKIRAMDSQKRKEEEEILELYLAAVGLW